MRASGRLGVAANSGCGTAGQALDASREARAGLLPPGPAQSPRMRRRPVPQREFATTSRHGEQARRARQTLQGRFKRSRANYWDPVNRDDASLCAQRGYRDDQHAVLPLVSDASLADDYR